jgi:hypothetical protein
MARDNDELDKLQDDVAKLQRAMFGEDGKSGVYGTVTELRIWTYRMGGAVAIISFIAAAVTIAAALGWKPLGH